MAKTKQKPAASPRPEAEKTEAPQTEAPRQSAQPTPHVDEIPKVERWQAALCYLSVLILVPASGRYRTRPFVAYHLNQGLVLLALGTLAGALYSFPATSQVGGYATLLVDALSMAGLVNVLMGRTIALPGVSLITKRIHPFG